MQRAAVLFYAYKVTFRQKGGAEKLFSYMRRKRRSGFTLLELIVVMAVIAILVAMGVPRFIGYQKDAKVTAMKADCKVLEDACMICYTEDNEWPAKDGEDSGKTINGIPAKSIDDGKVKDLYRSLSNEVGDYYLVTEGDSEGVVLYEPGCEDRGGDTWYGINVN